MMRARNDWSAVPAQWLRAISFVVALATSVTLMLFPFLLRYTSQNRLHAALPVVLFGLAGAFVYGVGYRPDNKLLRILFGPLCAWLLIAGGSLLLFS
jgi:predicted membrane protein